MVRKSYPNIITYCNSFMLITVTNTDKLDQVHPMSLTMLWTRYDVNSQSMLFILKCVENVLSFKSIKGQMELYDTHMKKCILLPAVFAFQSTKRWTAKHTSTQTSACAGAWRWLQLVWFFKASVYQALSPWELVHECPRFSCVFLGEQRQDLQVTIVVLRILFLIHLCEKGACKQCYHLW